MNFDSILETKMSDIEAPQSLPKGVYLLKVAKPYEESEVQDGKFKIVTFPCEVIEAGDQIDDPAALEAYGNPAGKSVRHQFWFVQGDELTGEEMERNASTLNKMKKFLEDALEIEAATVKDAMTEAVGHQFLGQIRHRPNNNNPDEPYLEIGNTGPVE